MRGRRHDYGDTVDCAKRLLARCARGVSQVKSSARTQGQTNETDGAPLICVTEFSDGLNAMTLFKHVFRICVLLMNICLGNEDAVIWYIAFT